MSTVSLYIEQPSYKLFLWWQLVITIAYIANAHDINKSEFYHFTILVVFIEIINEKNSLNE